MVQSQLLFRITRAHGGASVASKYAFHDADAVNSDKSVQSSIKIKLHYLDQLLLCSWVGGGVSQNFNGDLKGIRIEIKEWICECNLPSCHQRPLRGSTCPAKHQNILHEQLHMGVP